MRARAALWRLAMRASRCLISRLSRSSPPRCVSPAVASTLGLGLGLGLGIGLGTGLGIGLGIVFGPGFGPGPGFGFGWGEHLEDAAVDGE